MGLDSEGPGGRSSVQLCLFPGSSGALCSHVGFQRAGTRITSPPCRSRWTTRHRYRKPWVAWPGQPPVPRVQRRGGLELQSPPSCPDSRCQKEAPGRLRGWGVQGVGVGARPEVGLVSQARPCPVILAALPARPPPSLGPTAISGVSMNPFPGPVPPLPSPLSVSIPDTQGGSSEAEPCFPPPHHAPSVPVSTPSPWSPPSATRPAGLPSQAPVPWTLAHPS